MVKETYKLILFCDAIFGITFNKDVNFRNSERVLLLIYRLKKIFQDGARLKFLKLHLESEIFSLIQMHQKRLTYCKDMLKLKLVSLQKRINF